MKKFGVILSIISFCIHAQEVKPEEITPETLMDLSRSVQDQDIAIKGKKLLASINHLNPQLIKQLLTNPDNWSSLRADTQKKLEALQAIGHLSLAQANYVICDEEVCLKIAGNLNKLVNLLREYDKQHPEIPYEQSMFKRFWSRQLTSQDLEKIQTNQPTYQTVSRTAMAILIHQAIKKNDLRKIIIPAQAMIMYENTQDVSDANVVIAEERIKNFIPIQAFLTTKQIDDTTLTELCYVILEGKLWDLRANLALTPTGEFYLLDIEQPNKMNPSEAFFKNKSDVERSVINGFSELIAILVETQHSIDAVLAFIKTHPELMSYAGADSIKKYLM